MNDLVRHTEQMIDGAQLDLIKRTVAQNATNDELALYLHDCERQGVHPLDKLLHFTKRGGKYTPITSIDLMRTRAHDTGECAGIGDPLFVGEPGKPGFMARVIVYRFNQNRICEYPATARWEEYKPAPPSDTMWNRMPHTMLGKCAEALALRKAFPRQLAGLYAREEMDQADASEMPANAPTMPAQTPPPAAASDAEWNKASKRLRAVMAETFGKAINKEERPFILWLCARLLRVEAVNSTKDLSPEQMNWLADEIGQLNPEQAAFLWDKFHNPTPAPVIEAGPDPFADEADADMETALTVPAQTHNAQVE